MIASLIDSSTWPSISIVITAVPPLWSLPRENPCMFTPLSARMFVTTAIIPGTSSWGITNVSDLPEIDTSVSLILLIIILPPPMDAPRISAVLPASSVSVIYAVLGCAPSISSSIKVKSRPSSVAICMLLRIRASSVSIPRIPAITALSVPWPL